MTRTGLLPIVVGSFLLPFAGCNQAHPDTTAAARTREGAKTLVSPREALNSDDKLREIVGRLRNREYTAVRNWSFATPRCIGVASLSLSDAASDTPHGMKIYQAWAKNADAYLLAAKQDQPIGQVIVKESWVPKEVAAEEAAVASYAERDGKRYRPDQPSELFIMFKVDPTTPYTDDGWVYGIVTPDGKQVIASGRIETCVDCHRQARHDRVFGAKPTAN